MAMTTCPECGNPNSESIPAPTSCQQCGAALVQPTDPGACWFFTHQEKKHGPHTWQRLKTMAVEGELHAEDVLFQEGSRRWIRAGTLRTLFGPTTTLNPAEGMEGPDSQRPLSTLRVHAGKTSAYAHHIPALGFLETPAGNQAREESPPESPTSVTAEAMHSAPLYFTPIGSDEDAPASLAAMSHADDTMGLQRIQDIPTSAVETSGGAAPSVADPSPATSGAAIPGATTPDLATQAPLSWFVAGLTAASVCVLIGVNAVIVYFLITWNKPNEHHLAKATGSELRKVVPKEATTKLTSAPPVKKHDNPRPFDLAKAQDIPGLPDPTEPDTGKAAAEAARVKQLVDTLNGHRTGGFSTNK